MAFPNLSNGLFGMGGMGGFAPSMPQQMQGLIDPQELKRAQLKQLLLSGGLSMLGQGPSELPINLGTSIGQGLQAGVKAADQTGKDYRDTAYQTFKINQDADQQQYERGRDTANDDWRHKQFEYGMNRDKQDDTWKRTQFDYGVNRDGVNDQYKQREFEIAQAKAERDAQGASGVYGNVFWDSNNNPLALNKDGSGLRRLPIEGGGTVVDPATMVGRKADSKGAAQARVTYQSMTSKMPGLELVVDQLGDLADKATYTYAGQGRDAIYSQLGYATDGAVARKSYTSMVDNQILPMLRDTFGAQFTQREGETLRETLGDPNAPAASKKAVLKAFIEQKRRDIEALAIEGGIAPQQQMQQPSQGGGWQIEEVQ